MIKVLTKTKMKILAIGLLSIFLIACEKGPDALRIGSKPFSESMILAEMMAQLAENEGITVRRSIPYGPTQQVMEALKQDVIDVYPEYNGTALIFLGQAPTSDGNASTEMVQALFKPQGVELGGKFGFSNDYAMVMTADRSNALGVTSLSDLAGLTTPYTYAVDEDFIQRPADGLQQMNRRYGISGKAVKSFPLGSEGKDQIISALLDGTADVGELFVTDGQIAEYGLVVLEDDLGFFPVYEVSPLLRTEALAEQANLASVFDKLTGLMTAADMQAMNKAVDLDAQSPAAVATSFLVSKGLLPEDAAGADVEELLVAAGPDIGRNSATAKALKAIRSGFSGNDVKLSNTATPLAAINSGAARVSMVGAESFYNLGADGPVVKDNAKAFAVVGYKTAHLIAPRSGAKSISDMSTIITGPQGSGSAIVLSMILNSLGKTDSIGVVNSDSALSDQIGKLASGEADGVFAMASQGDRSVSGAMENSPVGLVSLNEWAKGGHTAKFSFIRPATIAAKTYASQNGAVASVSTQYVLAGPVDQGLATGDVGPGTAGNNEVTAVPVTADEVTAIREALGTGEIIDPAIPRHASLIPTIEVADKSLPFSLNISIMNILLLCFLGWALYLLSLPSPRNFTMPDED